MLHGCQAPGSIQVVVQIVSKAQRGTRIPHPACKCEDRFPRRGIQHAHNDQCRYAGSHTLADGPNLTPDSMDETPAYRDGCNLLGQLRWGTWVQQAYKSNL